MKQYSLSLENEIELTEVTRKLASYLKGKSVLVFLEGDLGAGKSTFMRYYLTACGYHGVVVSPTYTIVEIYELEQLNVVHADCYRLSKEDIFFLDFPSYLMEQKVHQLWIEWADQFKQVLPVWDLKIQFLHLGEEKRGLVLQTPVDSPLILDEIKS